MVADYPGPPANTIISDSTINTINYIGTFDNPVDINDPAFQRLSVDSLVNLNLFTGKAILLRQGFEVKQGAVFKAEIQNCGIN